MEMLVAYSLTQCAHPVPGGTGVAAIELRKALGASADPLKVVSVGAKGKRLDDPVDMPEPFVNYPVPYPALYELWNRTNRGAVDRLVPEADVVHLTMGLCPERHVAPQVCTVHDIFPVTYPEMLTRRGARVLQAGLKRVIERADLIATPSRATKDELVLHGVDAARIRVVPWGATPEPFSDDELVGIKQRFSLPDRFVLFAGTVEPRKNLDVLLGALERTGSDVHLVLVGPAGWGEIATDVPQLSRERLSVLGKQSRLDLLGLMTAASAVCMPSHAEGFGLPALEAMSQGTPVIHSQSPALREVVGNTGEQVDSTDVAGWAQAMDRFVEESSRSVELGSLAKDRASAFTWSATADSMRAVYEELL